MPGRKRGTAKASPSSSSEAGEVGDDRLADADVRRVAADDVGQHARPFLELDVGQHVGQVLAERRHHVLVGHGERVDGAPAGRDEVLDRVGQALHAERPGLVLDDPARRAALQHELAAPAALPPARASPTRRTAAGWRQCRSSASAPQDQASRRCGPRRACRRCRARTPAARPSTWRAPHSPRSCLTASITRKMPAHARVVRRQPAAVGVHRQRAAERIRPSLDERAALADLAEAEVLERRQHGDRERVVDHAQVDVVVGRRRPSRTPARPDWRAAIVSRSGAPISWWATASPQPSSSTGALRQVARPLGATSRPRRRRRR